MSSSSQPSRHARIAATLQGIVGRVLRIEPRDLDIEVPFLELGADSLALVEALRGLQEAFGVKLTIRQLFEQLPTISALAGFLEQTVPDSAPEVVQPKIVQPKVGEGLAPSRVDGGKVLSTPPAPPPAREGASPSPTLGLATPAPPVPRSGLEGVFGMQIQAFNQLVAQQLAMLGGRAPAPVSLPAPPVPEPKPHASPVSAPVLPTFVGKASGRTGAELNERQRHHLDALIERYCRKTAKSKELTQRYRPWLADSRATVGFRPQVKEMLYPLARARSRGSRLWDIDGNEYVDVTMGMGVHLFGHDPEFLRDTIAAQVREGFELGPRSADSGAVAALFCELTGMERAAFTNSGTEACMTAIRLARARTGRSRIVMFAGSYHGHSDGTLAQTQEVDGELHSFPVAPGVPAKVAEDVLVLDYGTPESLEIIRRYRHELAAVIVEPIQSRRPEVQPREFLHALRALTAESGIALIFDEMICGFRLHLGGAQAWFGVRADLATYGKIVGGGLPIGVVAGSAEYMDGIDGGMWRYGDDSHPERDTTFFGGTFCQHPLAMAAARRVLTYLKEQGPGLQEALNARTARFAGRLNDWFKSEGVPIRTQHAHSLFRFAFSANAELLYYHLVEKGVYVWEWRNCFLSTAHTDADLDFVVNAIQESVGELRRGGFLPEKPAGGPDGGERAKGFWDRQAKPAIAPTAPAAPATPVTARASTDRGVGFSLYFFGNYAAEFQAGKYDLLLDCARFADRNGFTGLWFPERHFHPFGGISPNPSVLAAALARETERISLRAGSVVLPLHHPLRVAEEWALVDNLSAGRVGLSYASGWHPNDFALAPEAYGKHRELMIERAAIVDKLWRGEALRVKDGAGTEVDLRIYPLPARRDLPIWITIVNNPETYRLAGTMGAGVLTNLMGQTVDGLAANLALYREALTEAGHPPDAGHVTLLLHTFLGPDSATAIDTARRPFYSYMESSVGLLKNMLASEGTPIDWDNLSRDDLEYMLELAYQRYVKTSALIGSAETTAPIVERLRAIGVDEIACLIDFGVAPDAVRASLPWMAALKDRFLPRRPAPGQERIEFPLTEAQNDLWTVAQLGAEASLAYLEAGILELRGPLDLPLLRRALQNAIDRHEALRTVIPAPIPGRTPIQRVLPVLDLTIPLIDATGCPLEMREAVSRQWLDSESRRRFDLTRGPLVRFSVLRMDSGRHRLGAFVHHIVSDGLSVVLFMREALADYEAGRAGRRAVLPEPFQFRDYAAWLARGGDESAADEAYWLQRFAGTVPVFDPPADHPRPAVRGFRGGRSRLVMEPAVYRALHQAGRRQGATLFISLLAAWTALLHRWTGQDDLVVGGPTARRPLEGGDRLVGHCVDLVPYRSQLGGGAEEAPFKSYLAAVRTTVLDAHDHGAWPLVRLLRALQLPHDPSRAPLINNIFNLDPGPGITKAAGLELFERSPVITHAKFDVALHVLEAGGELILFLDHRRDLFDAVTMDRLLSHLVTLAEGAAADPSRRLADLPLLSPAEQRQLTEDWNRTSADYPRDSTVHDLFAAVAARDPQAPAVVWTEGGGEAVMTYGELTGRAGRLADQLRAAGVGQETPVVLDLERSPDLVVAMLAVLQAGGAYVPVDPSDPEERRAYLVEDSGARVRVGSSLLVSPLPGQGRGEPGEGPGVRAPGGLTADALAYVIYTSGSTGRPKGVAVPHRAIVRLCRNTDYIHLGPGDRVAHLSNTAFDAATFEVWGALLNGAALVVIPRETVLVPADLGQEFRRRRVTATFLTTSLFHELVREAPETLHDEDGGGLRHLLFGGEAPSPDRVREALAAAGPDLRLVNVYGPTESTTFAMFHAIDRVVAVPAGERVPLGRPIANTRVWVLDRGLRLIPPGAPGELCIGGDGLARGYLGRPDLTAERFVPNPFENGDRLYRTGDLTRLRLDGNLEYLGRLDGQVKIRGFRIELGEIESALESCPGVRSAAVVVQDQEDGKRLVAYLTLDGSAEGTDPRAFLSARLPAAMIPASFVTLESFPLTPSGKIDRRALSLRVSETASEARPPFVAPRSPQEEAVAAAWSEVLRIERIGVDDDFFALGGHSLLAGRVLSRLLASLGVELSLRDFFSAPTVAGLAALAGEELAALGSDGEEIPPLRPVNPRPELLPLSFAQERLWLVEDLLPGSPVYSVPFAWHISGPLRLGALAAAFAAMVRRHEAIRTIFREVDGEPVQHILPPSLAPDGLPVADLSSLPEPLRKSEADRLLASEARRPFDLRRGPLVRPLVVRLDPQKHTFLLNCHHIVADGWSLGVMAADLSALATGQPLPPLPVQYADFALWQREWLRGAALESRLAWWRDRLAGCPTVLDLPADRPVQEERSGRGGLVRLPLPGLEPRVRQLARAYGSTPFLTYLTAFQICLQRLTGQDDLLVGTPVANRDRPELDGLVGFFVNTLALRTAPPAERTFADLLRWTRGAALGAYAHQDLPFEKLVEALAPQRDPSRNPLVQVIFSTPDLSPASLSLGPGMSTTKAEVETGTAKVDLSLFVQDGAGSFEGGFEGDFEVNAEYDSDRFDAVTVLRFLGHYRTLLMAAVAQPETPVADLVWDSDSERVQLARMPDPENPAAPETGFTPPRTPVEQIVAGAWADVLRVDRVGLHDDFFALGGHSLLAGRVLSRLRGTLNAELSLRDFFRTPTVAGLARQAENARRAGHAAPPIVPVPRNGQSGLRLSFAQERLWLIDQLQPGGSTYNSFLPALLTGQLHEPALEAALAAVLRRHEVLRTHFVPGPKGPVQVIAPPDPAWRLPVVDLRSLPENPRATELRRLVAAEARWPFDLAHGPLVRATLVRRTEDERALLLNLHHSVCDGWSLEEVLTAEMSTLYRAALAGTPLSLPSLAPLPVQYADFATWQRQWLQGEVLDRELAWWTQHLGGEPPALDLPTDHARPAVPGGRGAVTGIVLPPALVESLVALGRRRGVTLFMILLAVLQALLHRWSGQERISIGTPVANRGRLELEGLIGFFINTLVLCTDLSGNPSGTALLDRVRDLTLGAFDHQDLPFEKLVAAVQTRRDPSRNPLFQVLFVLQNNRASALDLPGVSLGLLSQGGASAALFDLSFSAVESAGSVVLSVAYSLDLFERPTVDLLLDHFRRIAESLAEDPQRAVDDIPLPSIPERRQVTAEASSSSAPADTPAPEAAREEIRQRREHLASRRKQLSPERQALLRKWVGGGPEAAQPAVSPKPKPEPVSPLVAIQEAAGAAKGNTQTPLFLVHPGNGNVNNYLDLSKHLGPNQPLYALQAPGLTGGEILEGMDAIATRYLEAVRTVQPYGPYRLGGWCMGGTFAYEMARRLRAAGEEVEILLLIDSHGPVAQPGEPNEEAALLASLANDFGGQAGRRLTVPLDELRRIPAADRLDWILAQARSAGALPETFAPEQARRHWEVFRANVRAIESYVPPEPLAVPTVLFRAAVQPAEAQDRPALGWDPWIAGPLDVIPLEGDHYGVVTEPLVRHVAHEVAERLAVEAVSVE